MSELVLSSDQHLAEIRRLAEGFLAALAAAQEAGVSQALILPMLMEILAGAGFGLADLGTLIR